MMGLTTLLELIRVRETVFGLTWVLSAALLALTVGGGTAGPVTWLLIVVAFTAARTAGMCFNRIIDRKIDAANPRTTHRMLATGEVSVISVALVAWSCILLFVGACWLLSPACLMLSPVAVALLIGYSYTKRFTRACHFVLGLIQSLGPMFAWAAVTGELSWTAVLMGLSVGLSIAGMDIIYSLQDYRFDAQTGLYSIAVALGPRRAAWMARGLHLIVIFLLARIGVVLALPLPWFVGIGVVAATYFRHHSMVDLESPESVPGPFFACNAYVGLTVLAMTTGVVIWHVIS